MKSKVTKSFCNIPVNNNDSNIYFFISLVEYDKLEDIILFISNTSHIFEGYIFINSKPIKEFNFTFPDFFKEKLIVILESNDINNNKYHLLESACSYNPEWICFMSINERFDNRYNPVKFYLKKSNHESLSISCIVTKDDETYICSEKNPTGVDMVTRIYRLSKTCPKYILDDKSSINKNSSKVGVLLRYKSTENNLNIYTTRKLADLFLYIDSFLNVQDISENNLEELIKQELTRIGKYFLNKEKKIEHIGYYSGDAGVLLLLSQLYLLTKDELYLNKVNDYVDHLLHLLETESEVKTSFCDGLAGIGWLFCYLTEKKLLEYDSGFFDDIDNILRFHIDVCKVNRNIDQMHGMISLGLYFLKRNNIKDTSYILQILKETAIYEKNEIKWLAPNFTKPPHYDFGLAHGSAGILFFLTQCIEKGIDVDLSRSLAEGIISFYENNEQNFESVGAYYPYSIEVKMYDNIEKDEVQTRLAWCYGDISILSTILYYSKITGNQILEQKTISKINKVSKIRECYTAVVNDPQFCHGASGLALMFRHLWMLTGEKDLKESANYWMKVVLAMKNLNYSDSGYLFLIRPQEWEWTESDPILEGTTGIGLSLLTFVETSTPDWMESLMLK